MGAVRLLLKWCYFYFITKRLISMSMDFCAFFPVHLSPCESKMLPEAIYTEVVYFETLAKAKSRWANIEWATAAKVPFSVPSVDSLPRIPSIFLQRKRKCALFDMTLFFLFFFCSGFVKDSVHTWLNWQQRFFDNWARVFMWWNESIHWYVKSNLI